MIYLESDPALLFSPCNRPQAGQPRLSPGQRRRRFSSPRRECMSPTSAEARRRSPLKTPSDLPTNAITDISAALTALLADVFTLYVKTKNFHWHMSGPHFRDYHLLLDEQAEQIFDMTDEVAERARKIGGTTLRSIGQIARQQRIPDNDADYVTPEDMLSEL